MIAKHIIINNVMNNISEAAKTWYNVSNSSLSATTFTCKIIGVSAPRNIQFGAKVCS